MKKQSQKLIISIFITVILTFSGTYLLLQTKRSFKSEELGFQVKYQTTLTKPSSYLEENINNVHLGGVSWQDKKSLKKLEKREHKDIGGGIQNISISVSKNPEGLTPLDWAKNLNAQYGNDESYINYQKVYIAGTNGIMYTLLGEGETNMVILENEKTNLVYEISSTVHMADLWYILDSLSFIED